MIDEVEGLLEVDGYSCDCKAFVGVGNHLIDEFNKVVVVAVGIEVVVVRTAGGSSSIAPIETLCPERSLPRAGAMELSSPGGVRCGLLK